MYMHVATFIMYMYMNTCVGICISNTLHICILNKLGVAIRTWVYINVCYTIQFCEHSAKISHTAMRPLHRCIHTCACVYAEFPPTGHFNCISATLKSQAFGELYPFPLSLENINSSSLCFFTGQGTRQCCDCGRYTHGPYTPH